ncbi:CsiV family protein [Marinobacter sp. V034]|uniref:CsiV family protein n=1 Tax=Marinobacter sp. V034 TaxID=3459610 RepID=UPI0040443EC1
MLNKVWNRWLALAVLGISFSAAAPQAWAADLYRAEFVLFERLAADSGIDEQMETRQPESPVNADKMLWVVDGNGQANTSMQLVPRSGLYLRSSAARLENSGRFKVLMAKGWVQSFPPNYKGQPLRVSVGDLIPGSDKRQIEGYINVDRLRYLHVTAHLNNWQAATASKPPADTNQTGSDASNSPYTAAQTGAADAPLTTATASDKAQLLTWLHETRRMRSGEIHYLDSPTIGLLVYFQPLKSN